MGSTLMVILSPLQSCSNTQIGEKLENRFDIIENSKTTSSTTNVKNQKTTNAIKKIKSIENDYEEENKKVQVNLIKNNSLTSKERSRQKSNKAIKKQIFNPQPYRIILKLSGANPSAPAETVTNALRKAGVEFEVEKIERFEEKNLSNDSSFKRKEF
mgnify:CR=1 FL=1